MRSRFRRLYTASAMAIAFAGCADYSTEPRLRPSERASLTTTSASGGGTLLGVAYSGSYPTGVHKLYSLDAVTGEMAEQVSLPTMDGLGGGLSALDSEGGRYVVVGSFAGPTGSQPRLVTVDVSTGASVVAAQPLPTWPSSIVFDGATDKLYLVMYSGSYPGGRHKLYNADLSSGAVTEVGSFPIMDGVSGILAVIDPATRRYTAVGLFRGSDQVSRPHLVSMDMLTGESSVAAAPLEGYLSSLEFDPSTSTLYGVAYRGNYPTGLNVLFRLDAGSGVATEVASFPLMDGLSGGLSSIDPAGAQYYIVGSFRTATGWEPRVVSMSLTSGATTVAQKGFPTFLSSLEFLSGTKPTIAKLLTDVRALEDGGTLGRGQAAALTALLDAALRQQESGKQLTAANQLAAFINKCEAYMRAGILTSAEGIRLIDSARAIISFLQAS